MAEASQCAALRRPHSVQAPNSPRPHGPSMSAIPQNVDAAEPDPHGQHYDVQAGK
jgi:hypothetical protein